jgi:fluoroacetyl-CoA thioesterase
MRELKIGMAAEASETVLHTNTAAAIASGTLDVYATPSMIALMEKAACKVVEPCLEEGTTTVGVSMSISHDSATPVGQTVTAKAVLTGVDGRKLSFKVIASDDYGTIGQGLHERFLINREKFLGKLKAKKG